eukprot:jgi/Mesvir1/10461/Mv22800-RA.1
MHVLVLCAQVSGPSATLSTNPKKVILRDFLRLLRQSGSGVFITNSQLIFGARIPLLKFIDERTGLRCDVTIDNGAAVTKSLFVGQISRVDPRCRQLVYLVKRWAKAQEINNPAMGGINSYALILMLIFHLQSVHPPLLPPLKNVLVENPNAYPGGGLVAADSSRWHREHLLRRSKDRLGILRDEGFFQKNRSSTAELFASFFEFYHRMDGHITNGDVICPFTGRWEAPRKIWQNNMISVQDPFEVDENCGRSVQPKMMPHIRDLFRVAVNNLSTLTAATEGIFAKVFFDDSFHAPRREDSAVPHEVPSGRRTSPSGNRGRPSPTGQRGRSPPPGSRDGRASPPATRGHGGVPPRGTGRQDARGQTRTPRGEDARAYPVMPPPPQIGLPNGHHQEWQQQEYVDAGASRGGLTMRREQPAQQRVRKYQPPMHRTRPVGGM